MKASKFIRAWRYLTANDETHWFTSMFFFVCAVVMIVLFVALSPGCNWTPAETGGVMKELLPELCVEKEGWRMCLSRVDGLPPNGVPDGTVIAGPERCMNEGGAR